MTAYEIRISDLSSYVCSSDLGEPVRVFNGRLECATFVFIRRDGSMVDPQIPVDASLQAGIDGQLPGKRTDPASMLRVDQAGEYGATRIYAGQLAVMGDRHPDALVIRRMAQQEESNRQIPDTLLTESGARTTRPKPPW